MTKEKNQANVFLVGFVLIAVVVLWSLARPIFKNLSKKSDESEKMNAEIAKAPVISAEELFEKIKIQDNLLIFDLRSQAEFEKGHVATSVSSPIGNFSAGSLSLGKSGKNSTIVLLDQGEKILEIAKKTNELVSAGYPNAKYLDGGISSWQAAGYALVSSGGSEFDKSKVKTITVQNLADDLLSGQDIAFVDIRSASDFSAGHIPGALNIPFSEIEKRAKEISPVKKVILYGNGESEARKAAVSLFDLDFLNTHVLEGGLDSWKREDGKIE